MKRLFILALVFTFASAADATVLSWSVDAVTLGGPGQTCVVQLVADDADPYDWKWVGHTPASTPIATITSIAARASAGPNGGYKDPEATTYPGWWQVRALDLEAPYTISSGPQFDVTIMALSWGTFGLNSDSSGTNDILEVTAMIPEPTTIGLLALGGLGLLRKRRR